MEIERTNEGRAPDAGHSDSSTEKPTYKRQIAKWFRNHFGGHKALEWLTFVFEVLTFVALCIYSYFSYGQWRAMKDQKNVMQGQLDQMKSGSTQTDAIIREAQTMSHALVFNNDLNTRAVRESLKQSRTALKSAVDNSRIELRAYLGPKSSDMEPIEVESMKPIRAIVRILNSGRTVGIMRYRTNAILGMGKLDTLRVFSAAEWKKTPFKGPTPVFPVTESQLPFEVTELNAAAYFQGAAPALRAFLEAHPEIPRPSIDPSRLPLPPEPLKAAKIGVLSGDLILFIIGEIDYIDVFKDSHVTKFCGQYDSVNKVFSACPNFPDYAN